MRLFIAIPIPDTTCNLIAEKIKPLQKKYQKLRWVSINNYHITLAFLGEINQEKYLRISAILDKLTLPQKFILKLEKFGAFPNLISPKVFWLAFNKELELIKLQQNIEGQLRKYQLITTPKNIFEPHLTIARAKERIDNKETLKINLEDNLFFEVSHFNLYKSDLTTTGPIYSIIQKYSLN